MTNFLISMSTRWPGFPTRVACYFHFDLQGFYGAANDIEDELIVGLNWMTSGLIIFLRLNQKGNGVFVCRSSVGLFCL